MYLEMIVQFFMQVAVRKGRTGEEARVWALRRAQATLKTWLNRIEAELEKL